MLNTDKHVCMNKAKQGEKQKHSITLQYTELLQLVFASHFKQLNVN